MVALRHVPKWTLQAKGQRWIRRTTISQTFEPGLVYSNKLFQVAQKRCCWHNLYAVFMEAPFS